jgi:hypothetical protein
VKPKASDVQSAQQVPDTTTKLPAAIDRKAVRKTAAKAGRVTGKLAIACRRIVHEGEELDEAAHAADLTTRTLRLALAKPHVIAWVKAEREVFRAYVSAQNIHHAKKMRDTSGNAMAKLGAMKLIEQIGDDAPASSAQSAPGMVIVVVNQAPGASVSATVEHKPMQIIDNATGLNRE